MTDNLARARAWLEPVLSNWCDEWSAQGRQEFLDQLAERLMAAVAAKGIDDATVFRPSEPCGECEELEVLCDVCYAQRKDADALLARASDIPEPPR